MPKGFSLAEKEIIEESLLLEGKKLFSDFGFKKTCVEDLTKAVNIAQGSFYNFYTSKESLYYVIFEMEEKNIKNNILKHTENCKEISKNTLTQLILTTIDEIESHPIVFQMYTENILDKVLRKIAKVHNINFRSKDTGVLIPLTTKWISMGLIKQDNSENAAKLIRSLIIISNNQHQFNNDFKYIKESLAKGISEILY